MKSRKIIGIMLLCATITGSTVIAANAAGVDSNSITKPAVVNTISAKDVTDSEFNDVVGPVQKEQNSPIVKDLMKKAKNYLGNGFYVEMKVTCEGGAKENGIVKKYWQDGNYRSEQFDMKGNLLYVTVCNKAEDTRYTYDAKNNKLDKTTDYYKKHCLANNRAKYSFLCLDSARFGDLKTIDYNGKKAVYSKDISQYDDKTKVDTQIWYDAETGMILNYQQKSFEPDGKTCVYTTDNYIVKPNQTFDSSIFKYNENNKSVGDLKLN